MTERKPFNTGYEPWIESQIRIAVERPSVIGLPR